MGKLQDLITEIKQTPMNFGTLRKLLPPYAGIKTLSEISTRSKTFGQKQSIVVLIPSSFSDIGHFVVLTKFPKYIEYFSSFGRSPEKELTLLGQKSEALLALLGKKHIYNSKKLQGDSTTIEDCALFVLARVILRKLKLRQFQELFQSRVTLQNPDDIISMLCILLLVDA